MVATSNHQQITGQLKCRKEEKRNHSYEMKLSYVITGYTSDKGRLIYLSKNESKK